MRIKHFVPGEYVDFRDAHSNWQRNFIVVERLPRRTNRFRKLDSRGRPIGSRHIYLYKLKGSMLMPMPLIGGLFPTHGEFDVDRKDIMPALNPPID